MRVKMLKNAPGSPDGVKVLDFIKGEVYEVSESLAEAFLRAKLAVEHKAEGKKASAPAANKQVSAPAENKSE